MKVNTYLWLVSVICNRSIYDYDRPFNY